MQYTYSLKHVTAGLQHNNTAVEQRRAKSDGTLGRIERLADKGRDSVTRQGPHRMARSGVPGALLTMPMMRPANSSLRVVWGACAHMPLILKC